MALKKFKPESPDKALGKIKGDNEFARLGHLNKLVSDVDSKKADQEIHNISYPFYNYPEATLINAGATYEYPAGIGIGPIPAVTFNTYKVKGITQYSGSSILSIYLGTVKIKPNVNGWISSALVFPGKLTGMVMATNENGLLSSSDFTTTPLADGAMMWDTDAGSFNKLNDVRVMMYAYENNPINGTQEVNYALVLEAYGTVPTSDFATALISYEFEFVSVSDAAITLWWD